MTRIIHGILAGILVLLPFFSEGQQPHNKKDTRIIIQQTWKLYVNQNYEGAISYWYGPRPLCRQCKLSKKLVLTRNTLDRRLGEKKAVFDYHQNLVSDRLMKFTEGIYCEADTLMKLELDETNSYGKTRAILRKNMPRIVEATRECEKVRTELETLSRKAESGDWETVINVIDRPGKVAHLRSYVKTAHAAELEQFLELIDEARMQLSGAGKETRELTQTASASVKSIKALSQEFSKLFQLIKTNSESFMRENQALKEEILKKTKAETGK